ncbi:unnamed protein product, partial [Protopolystoma xenopodis]
MEERVCLCDGIPKSRPGGSLLTDFSCMAVSHPTPYNQQFVPCCTRIQQFKHLPLETSSPPTSCISSKGNSDAEEAIVTAPVTTSGITLDNPPNGSGPDASRVGCDSVAVITTKHKTALHLAAPRTPGSPTHRVTASIGGLAGISGLQCRLVAPNACSVEAPSGGSLPLLSLLQTTVCDHPLRPPPLGNHLRHPQPKLQHCPPELHLDPHHHTCHLKQCRQYLEACQSQLSVGQTPSTFSRQSEIENANVISEIGPRSITPSSSASSSATTTTTTEDDICEKLKLKL